MMKLVKAQFDAHKIYLRATIRTQEKRQNVRDQVKAQWDNHWDNQGEPLGTFKAEPVNIFGTPYKDA